jgi:hypothetical protein
MKLGKGMIAHENVYLVNTKGATKLGEVMFNVKLETVRA